MAVKAIAFAVYSVKDVPRSIAFYRDIVGLTPGDLVSDKYAEFDVGGTTFAVGNGESIGIAPGSQFSVGFEVDDVASFRKSLTSKGVEVSDVMEGPLCASCFATDPDGNRFAVHKRKAQ